MQTRKHGTCPLLRSLALLALLLGVVAGCTSVAGVRDGAPVAARVYPGDARELADALVGRLAPERRQRDGDLALDEVKPPASGSAIELRVFEPSWSGDTLELLVTLTQAEPGHVRVELRSAGSSATGREARQVWHWFNRAAGPAIDPDALD